VAANTMVRKQLKKNNFLINSRFGNDVQYYKKTSLIVRLLLTGLKAGNAKENPFEPGQK
jgi:hypothetical protein